MKFCAFIILGLVACISAQLASAWDFGTGTKITTNVEYSSSTELTPPQDSDWQTTTLPMFRASPHFEDMADQETLWFRVPFSELTTESSSRQSLYIWRHNMRLAVYLDQVHLGGTAKQTADGWQGIGWNHPVLVDLPIAQSTGEFDYVYLRVDGGPGGIILSPLVSGDSAKLKDAFDSRHLLQIEMATWSFFLCVLLTALSLWLWAQRRKDGLYLHFAAMSFLSAVALTFFFYDEIPGNLHIWLIAQHGATDWVSFFMLAYTARALEQQWKQVQKGALAICVMATIAYLVLPAYYLQPVAYLIHASLSLIMFVVGLRVFYLTWQQPQGTRIWFSIAFIGFFTVNVHDFNAVFLSTPEQYIEASNWLHLTSPFMAIAFFAHLVHRFVNALDISEQLNRDLESRVKQTQMALEASYAENREMELQHTADAERQKIYRELHDDLGSKLVSIVHSAEGSKQSELARGALESLRESIYKARHGQQSIEQCISSIVAEAELRLEGAGIQFTNDCDTLPDTNIGPEVAYNLTRIMREAVSNLLQHSGADAATLYVELEGDELIISLVDQGIGRVKEFFASGGLNNIRFRAERIGADVDWVPGEPGCRFLLRLKAVN